MKQYKILTCDKLSGMPSCSEVSMVHISCFSDLSSLQIHTEKITKHNCKKKLLSTTRLGDGLNLGDGSIHVTVDASGHWTWRFIFPGGRDIKPDPGTLYLGSNVPPGTLDRREIRPVTPESSHRVTPSQGRKRRQNLHVEILWVFSLY